MGLCNLWGCARRGRWYWIVLLAALCVSSSPHTWLGSVQGNADASSAQRGTQGRSTARQGVWVFIIGDGKKQQILTTAQTVAEVLAANNIVLNELDRTSPAPNAAVKSHMRIYIARVRVETTTQQKPSPFKTEFQYSRHLRRGETKVVQEGENGVIEQEVQVWYRDGKETLRKPIGDGKVVEEPVPRIVLVGSREAFSSRGGLRTRRALTMDATAYAPGAKGGSLSNRTATGLRAGYGVIAVDPRVIPYGTRVYIEGYGFAVAADCGGAIKGTRIDLCFDDYRQALNFGRQNVKVYILE